MVDNCEIKDTVAIYQWFNRIVNVHSHHQQAAYKWDGQIVEIDADVSVYIMKKAAGLDYE